jgi:hypothetical protein
MLESELASPTPLLLQQHYRKSKILFTQSLDEANGPLTGRQPELPSNVLKGVPGITSNMTAWRRPPRENPRDIPKGDTPPMRVRAEVLTVIEPQSIALFYSDGEKVRRMRSAPHRFAFARCD